MKLTIATSNDNGVHTRPSAEVGRTTDACTPTSPLQTAIDSSPRQTAQAAFISRIRDASQPLQGGAGQPTTAQDCSRIPASPGTVQRFLYIGDVEKPVSSGEIVNPTQRPLELNAAVSKMPLDIKWEVDARLRELTLDNDNHRFNTWAEAVASVTPQETEEGDLEEEEQEQEEEQETEEEGEEVEIPDEFKHFRSGNLSDIAFTSEGQVKSSSEEGKASGQERKSKFASIGISEHALKGHFKTDMAMKGDAGQGIANFSFSSDRELAIAVELGRQAFADNKGGKIRFLEPGFSLGYGYVKDTDGNLYKVFPKRYRVVKKQQGDFKTAYGETEVTDPKNFDQAYFKWEKVE